MEDIFFIGRFEKTPPLVGGDESDPTSNKKKITWPSNI